MAKKAKVPEKAVLAHVWNALCKLGFTLWRNNSGAIKTGNRFIRFGVGNPGGSDLLGYRSFVVTPEMVGKRIAQFAAIECKNSSGGVLTVEQRIFLKRIKEDGGIAEVASSIDDVMRFLDKGD